MAPQIPKKRITARARASKASTSRSSIASSGPKSKSFSTSISTKEDKRRIKHANLISRIEKANTTRPKRRRPSKKLITTLESLADALPDAGKKDGGDAIVGGALVRHASLKSRPGATKRKEKLEAMERDRFARNLAQMSTTPNVPAKFDTNVAAGAATSGTSARWAALRRSIQLTIDSNKSNSK